MISDFFKLSFKNLQNRKLRSWLTMLGIFVGIAAVVALISLSQGLQGAITQQFASMGTDKLVVQGAGSSFGPPGLGTVGKVTKDDVELIEKISGVENALGRILEPVKIEYNDIESYTFIVSSPEKDEDRKLAEEVFDIEYEYGRGLKSGDKYKVVIGYASANGEKNGFEKDISLSDNVKINGQDFEVIGIIKKTGQIMQDGVFVVPEDILRELSDNEEEFNVIAVQAKQNVDLEELADEIEKEMRKDRGQEEGEEDFSVETPGQIVETANSILGVVTAVLIGIASISLLVGGIGIMNTMYTAVLQRTKEIGIMKSIGAKNSDIQKIFLIESGLLGLVGGAIGVVLGASAAKLVEIIASNQFGIDILKAHFPWYLIIGALIFSFLVGTISGVMPARQAARMNPVDALRFKL